MHARNRRGKKKIHHIMENPREKVLNLNCLMKVPGFSTSEKKVEYICAPHTNIHLTLNPNNAITHIREAPLQLQILYICTWIVLYIFFGL